MGRVPESGFASAGVAHASAEHAGTVGATGCPAGHGATASTRGRASKRCAAGMGARDRCASGDATTSSSQPTPVDAGGLFAQRISSRVPDAYPAPSASSGI
jgi:hypothetical protein